MKYKRVNTQRPLLGVMAPENHQLILDAEKEHGLPFLKILEGYAMDRYTIPETARILGFHESQFRTMLDKIDPGLTWKKRRHVLSATANWRAKNPGVYDYKSEYWRTIRAGIRASRPLSEISTEMGVPLTTFYRRLRAHPDALEEHHDATE